MTLSDDVVNSYCGGNKLSKWVLQTRGAGEFVMEPVTLDSGRRERCCPMEKRHKETKRETGR